METETFRDVIQWTREYHERLSVCLKSCSDKQRSERAKLLLGYLSDHEKKLSIALKGFESSAELSALSTWCYEYLDKSPFKPSAVCNQPFEDMTTDQIIEAVEDRHQQIIGLYRYLRGRASISSTIELLDQLTSLEEHEAMQMAHAANRLEDM